MFEKVLSEKFLTDCRVLGVRSPTRCKNKAAKWRQKHGAGQAEQTGQSTVQRNSELKKKHENTTHIILLSAFIKN